MFASTTVMALSEHAPEATETARTHLTNAHQLEKRAFISCTIQVDGLVVFSCPQYSCNDVGQLFRGAEVAVICYTRVNTTTVLGDAGWAEINGEGWISMAFGQHLTCTSGIPPC